jgi:CMP-N,N'-diacetyllegionaminic acid synthase
MRMLFVVPARGGSKGLPGKNIRLLGGVPLINYSLKFARLFADDKDICISTDSPEIAKIVELEGYQLPFIRPATLSDDNAGMGEVLKHALQHFENLNGPYDILILLQPTSPFRKKLFLEQALEMFNKNVDMVVSVKESKANPYFNLFEENEFGFLFVSKNKNSFGRRQDAPKVYQYNGNIYIINCNSLRASDSLSSFKHIIKYLMTDNYSIDIDNLIDWKSAEYLFENQLVTIDGKC